MEKTTDSKWIKELEEKFFMFNDDFKDTIDNEGLGKIMNCEDIRSSPLFLVALIIQDNIKEKRAEILSIIKKINKVCLECEEKKYGQMQSAVSYCGLYQRLGTFRKGWVKRLRYVISPVQTKSNYVYDTIVAMANKMLYQFDEYKIWGSIFILSDGQDEESKATFKEVKQAIKELQELDIRVFCPEFASEDLQKSCEIITPTIDYHDLRNLIRMDDIQVRDDVKEPLKTDNNYEFTNVYFIHTGEN